MPRKEIFSSNKFKLFLENTDVFIETYDKILFEDINKVLVSMPQIKLTEKEKLRIVILKSPQPATKIGTIIQRIEITITANDSQAYVSFNLSASELDKFNRQKLLDEVANELRKNNVSYGINLNLLSGDTIQNSKQYLVAQGVPPTPGTNAQIKMYEVKSPVPIVSEDGKANFYEVRLINKVHAGDWLGQKLTATEGVPGISVKNCVIPAIRGADEPLLYDKNSVLEISQSNLSSLFARNDGAVQYEDQKIKIQNHMNIEGDVDYSTGNIDFNGYLTIKGTVTDGFSVKAKNDIEILSPMGLGNVKEIISTEGNIFIKGGIIPKSRVYIHAAGSVFIKFCNNVNIECGGSLHIGYYCEDTTARASEIVIDSESGSIIGSQVTAKYKIVVPYAGSKAEKRTQLEITGFNREDLVAEITAVNKNIQNIETQQLDLKRTIQTLESRASADPKYASHVVTKKSELINLKIKLIKEKKLMADLKCHLRTRGCGEITIKKCIYPNSKITLLNRSQEIKKPNLSVSLVYQEGEVVEFI